jgi:hypothetical protein
MTCHPERRSLPRRTYASRRYRRVRRSFAAKSAAQDDNAIFHSTFVSTLKLKIDVSGTVGDAAWREINQFDQIQSADFGPQFGSGGRCNHPPDAPHAKGEWIGAEIRLQTPLLAQYAMSHYLEQERVLDADVE